jgi:hypothetical protein
VRRRLFNFAAVVSLVFCLATVGLWVRSHWMRYYVSVGWLGTAPRSFAGVVVDSVRGQLSLSLIQGSFVNQNEFDKVTERPWHHFYFGRGPALNGMFQGRHGFGYVARTFVNPPPGPTQITHAIITPDWLPTALFALFPTWHWLSVWRKSRLPQPGHCVVCRYSLTGNTSGICPECGTAVKQPSEMPGSRLSPAPRCHP